MLGTWRTNDAEKNHTHKIGKRKKKKEKRNPTMDGMGLENGMAFCVGRNRNRNRKGKHTKEGRNYDTIRGGRRRSRSGTSEHNQPYLTLPYLLHMHFLPFVGGLRSGCCSRLHATYLLLQVQGRRWVPCYCATRALPPPPA